jgi:hypothetical protein
VYIVIATLIQRAGPIGPARLIQEPEPERGKASAKSPLIHGRVARRVVWHLHAKFTRVRVDSAAPKAREHGRLLSARARRERECARVIRSGN